MPTVANKVKYGLKNVYYAPITFDNDQVPTFDTPVRWPGAVTLTTSAEGEQNKFRADNIDYYVTQSNGGYTGDLECALIPDSFRTSILGEINTAKGVIVEDAAAIPKQFALLFQFEGDQHPTRHVLYNCTASRPGVEGETTGESIEPKTETVSITAIAVRNTFLDTDIVKAKTNENTDETTYNNWFTTVYWPAQA